MPKRDIIDRAYAVIQNEHHAEDSDHVIRDLISEVMALRGVAARSDAAVSALVRANGRWSTLAGFLYGLMTRTCERQALEIARQKWEEAHAKDHD
jgi:hypothetical protein